MHYIELKNIQLNVVFCFYLQECTRLALVQKNKMLQQEQTATLDN